MRQNNNFLFQVLSAFILLLGNSCKNKTNEDFINYHLASFPIIVEDTIPPTIEKIQNEYIVSFTDKKITDFVNNLSANDSINLFDSTRGKASKIEGDYLAILNKKFDYLNLSTNKLLLADKDMFVANIHSDIVDRLVNDLSIKNVETDYRITIHSNFASIISLPSEETPWGIRRVSTLIKQNSTYVKKVWIVDSGIDPNHEDLNVDAKLSTSFYPGTKFSDVDGLGNDHGTQVAGIIGAKRNGKGIIGIAPNARLVAIKYIHNNNFNYSYYLAALKYVLVHAQAGDICNLSVENTPGSKEEESVLSAIAAKNVIVIISAGNYQRDVDKQDQNVFPAKFNGKNIYTVSAFSEGDTYSKFSNYGESIDISAPGQKILTTLPNNRYGINEGTSFSAPYVSGIAYLIGHLNFDGFVKQDPDIKIDPIIHE